VTTMTEFAPHSPQSTSGTVRSADGTVIAYSRAGAGPSVVLVDGALNDRAFNGPNPRLALVLAAEFTVITYDRRGRGESGDTPPYSTDREIEDLEAVIEAAGGTAYVYGISSGGALALEAASRLSSIEKLALYELPFVTDDSRKPIPADFTVRLAELVDAGRRADAVRYFFTTGIGLPRIMVGAMRVMPAWPKLVGLAHTLPYDTRFIGDAGSSRPLPAERWANATMPTWVGAGSKSPKWTQNAMRELASVLPNAEHRPLKGQTHIVKPAALAPALSEFFNAPRQNTRGRKHEVPCHPATRREDRHRHPGAG
jgi:pimeloyl-ACP methyl ester carboxylesterase